MGRKDRHNPRRAATLAEPAPPTRIEREPPSGATRIGESASADPAKLPVDSAMDLGRSIRRFRVAITVTIVWIAALAALAWSTANPVTFNREQLRRAQRIVTATVTSLADGTVAVEKEWTDGVPAGGGPLVLDNLERTEARDGGRYLIPLSIRPDGAAFVTETRLPNDRPLIYAATPETEAELTDLLKQLAP